MPTPQPPVHIDAPIQDFSHCHAGILARLQLLDELPALLEPAARARGVAAQLLEFFRDAVFEHHLDEERELFPAVLASADMGAEREQVQRLVQRLTQEHRELEAAWKALEPGLRKVAKGLPADLEATAVAQLVSRYRAHAAFEEQEFLPLSQTILGRNANHLSALGLSLHMRHNPVTLRGVI